MTRVFRRRKPEPVDLANLRMSMEVENVITRLDAVVDRLDIVGNQLLAAIDALTVPPKRERDRGGKPGLAH